VIIAGLSIYSFLQSTKAKNNVDALNILKVQLKDELTKTESDYVNLKKNNQKEYAIFEESLATILPKDEAITNFNRQLEAYFNSINGEGNPIFLESITYGSAKELEDYKGVFALPFSLTFNGTNTNFFKTIEYLENSGAIGNSTRLVEVKKININYDKKSDKDSKIELIDFQIDAYAYFYNPA
jgi:hypothetical protein